MECERHESLLNVAFAAASGFSLLCPYDTSTLDPQVLVEAERNHPSIVRSGRSYVSERYDGHIPDWLESPLSPTPPNAVLVPFENGSEGSWHWLRQRTAQLAISAGLLPSRVDDVVLAVSEAVSNSVDHGGGHGRLSIWQTDGRLVCEVADQGSITDPLAGRVRPRPTQPDGRGLWLINQLSDLTQLRLLPDGQRLRMQFAI